MAERPGQLRAESVSLALSCAQLDAATDALAEALDGDSLEHWTPDEVTAVREAHERMRAAWNYEVNAAHTESRWDPQQGGTPPDPLNPDEPRWRPVGLRREETKDEEIERLRDAMREARGLLYEVRPQSIRAAAMLGRALDPLDKASPQDRDVETE